MKKRKVKKTASRGEKKISPHEGGLSRTGRLWVVQEAKEKDILYIKQKYNVSDMIARLAVNRLRDISQADEIFYPFLKNHLPDPDNLPDNEKAMDHLYTCILEKRPLCVWGDYDVDGACSAALCVRYFTELGCKIIPYVSDRFQEGYGPNKGGFFYLKSLGIKDVIVVDCGTTAFAPLEWAHENGINIIIIDHHRVAETHPKCLAFINPKREDYMGTEILKTLCAGALVFLFLVGMNRYLRDKGFFQAIKEVSLMDLLDLVALSTICDMMPLRHVNRAFVKQGLKIMRRRKNLGLSALVDSSGIREAPNTIHIGYTMGPRINAGGRIGDSSLGVRLLSSTDKEESLKMAEALSTLNMERQQIERQVEAEAHQQALEQEHLPFLFLRDKNWHEGVLGIIASHLKEIFYKTTFVLSDKSGFLKGSVRSVPGIDIGELIQQACDLGLLVTGGGHPMAGGLTIEYSKVDDFLQFAQDFFRPYKDITEKKHPPITIDMAVTIQAVRDRSFSHALSILEPFGADYPQPKFLLPQVRLENVTPFGYNHLKMRAVQLDGQKYPLVYFRSADKPVGAWICSEEAASTFVDCVVTVQLNNRFAISRANLVVEDIR